MTNMKLISSIKNPLFIGVNERIPKFSEFSQVLQENFHNLSIDIYTHTHLILQNQSAYIPLSNLYKWNLNEAFNILPTPVDLALSIQLNNSFEISPRCQRIICYFQLILTSPYFVQKNLVLSR